MALLQLEKNSYEILPKNPSHFNPSHKKNHNSSQNLTSNRVFPSKKLDDDDTRKI